MKNILISMAFVACCLVGGEIRAGTCGGGKVVEIVEGGWNSNDLLIKLDYSDSSVAVQHPNFRGFVRYLADPEMLPTERLESIRKLALTALISGKTVAAYTHSNSCAQATQLTLYAFK